MFFNATTFYSFWEYWELRHDVTFDGVNKLIYINPGVTALDIDSDIYSEWKEWSQTEDNMKYLNPWSVIGGEPTVEGQRLD
jgi:hypothetical protein